MKQSTIELLKRISAFSKAAAKLQMHGPAFPQDPNFTGLVDPKAPYNQVQAPDTQNKLLTPKDRESGVYLANNVVKQNVLDALESLQHFQNKVKLLLGKLKDSKANAKSPYRIDLFQSSILEDALNNIINELYFSSTEFSAIPIKKKLLIVQNFIGYLQENSSRFLGVKEFSLLFNNLSYMFSILNQITNTLPKGNESQGNGPIYDMFSEEDAKEDAEVALKPMSHESMMKDEPLSGPAIQQLPVQIQKIPDSDPSLSFEFEPMKF